MPVTDSQQRTVDAEEPGRVTRDLLHLLGEKWTLSLLHALTERPQRYSELRRRVALTSKALSRTLRLLEAGGLVTHLEFPALRRQVHYELTPAGRELREFVSRFDARFADRAAPRRAPRPLPYTTESDDDAVTRSSRRESGRADAHFLLVRVVSITVRDLDAVVPLVETIFGAHVTHAWRTPITEPDAGLVRVAFVELPGFVILLVQPVEGQTPHQAFVDRCGGGIQHLGLSSESPLEPLIKRLMKRGGTCVTRFEGNDTAARIDFSERLGVAFGVYPARGLQLPATAREDVALLAPDALASQRLTNVGIVVRDIHATARAYADLFHMGVTALRTVDLPAAAASREPIKARSAYLRQEGVAIKLLEPLGGPLLDVVLEFGNHAHHVGFEVGEYFETILSRLEAAGGTVLAGRRDCGYVLIDFSPQLGMAFELSGIPTPVASST